MTTEATTQITSEHGMYLTHAEIQALLESCSKEAAEQAATQVSTFCNAEIQCLQARCTELSEEISSHERYSWQLRGGSTTSRQASYSPRQKQPTANVKSDDRR